MADDHPRAASCRAWYAKLLRLYPLPHRERFGESMQQTFDDLCRERLAAGRGLSGLLVWIFAETALGIFREVVTMMAAQNRRLVIMLLGITCILLLPLVAMQFTREVNWSPADFGVVGALLLVACITFEFLARRVSGSSRYAIGIAIVTVVVLVWLELAVGVFGSPWAGT
jgi:hypothetical protein